MDRLSKDMRLWRWAFEWAKNATCDRARHGCIIARDGLVLAEGYNGSVNGEPHCDEAGHALTEVQPVRLMTKDEGILTIKKNGGYPYVSQGPSEIHCTRIIHAEQNAILNAAIIGVSIENASWYITGVPCWRCSKMIARTNPWKIFMCLDRSPNQEIIKWWYDRIPKQDVVVYPELKDDLVTKGVIDKEWLSWL